MDLTDPIVSRGYPRQSESRIVGSCREELQALDLRQRSARVHSTERGSTR